MERQDALRVIENLRKGLPPSGFIEHYTVGREAEIRSLSQSMENGNGTPVLLLKANYGSGKSHLLRFIREKAHADDYAVSLVTLDAKSGVRFNRMDQIMGEILRNIEIPPQHGKPGLRGVLDFIKEQCDDGLDREEEFWEKLAAFGSWDFSETLACEPLFVAIRAWVHGRNETKELVIDWLQKPELYRTQRGRLYTRLVEELRNKFRDPRPDWEFYKSDFFLFHTDNYRSAWDALKDMHILLENCGLRGLIILFDEFEDVLTNLNNINWQESAFWNLFLFFSGKRFPGKSFYAVTPAFTEKCKIQLMLKGKWDFDYSRFDKLPTFEMSPLGEDELYELAKRICRTHSLAFNYQIPEHKLPVTQQALLQTVQRSVQSPVQDRARHTIREVVQYLDEEIQN
jgi:hypothetical protein